MLRCFLCPVSGKIKKAANGVGWAEKVKRENQMKTLTYCREQRKMKI